MADYKMAALAQSPNPLDAPTAAHEPLIVFENVSIAFDTNEVLKKVSFHVERGQTLCILGRSGVGKSVSLRILMGFLKPDSGSVRFEGQEITELAEDELRPIREKVTMVFQNGALYGTEKYGTFWLQGAVLKTYQGLGGSGSFLGFPTRDQYQIGGAWAADFEGGTVRTVNGVPKVYRK